MSRVEQAVDNFNKHYNCSQSVLCAYCDLLGLSEVQAFRLAEGFGGGMGMQETCGAVTGMFAVLSYLNSDGLLANGKTKAENYKMIRRAAEEFKSVYGSIICREILANKQQPKDHRCVDKVRKAAEILEKFLLPTS